MCNGVNDKNQKGFTLLHMACVPKGNANAVKFLIDNKADLNITSKYGTALHIATQREKTDTVQLLLEAKSDVSIQLKRKTAYDIARDKSNLVLQGLFDPK